MINDLPSSDLLHRIQLAQIIVDLLFLAGCDLLE